MIFENLIFLQEIHVKENNIFQKLIFENSMMSLIFARNIFLALKSNFGDRLMTYVFLSINHVNL